MAGGATTFQAHDLSNIAGPAPDLGLDWLNADPVWAGLPGVTLEKVSISQDSRVLAYADSTAQNAYVFDLEAQTKLVIPGPVGHEFDYVATISPSGAWLALTTYQDAETESVVRVYDAGTGVLLADFPTLTGSANFVAWSEDESLFLVGTGDTLAPIDTSSWTIITLGTAPPGEALSGKFSPDGTKCAIRCWGSNGLIVYETATWTSTALTPEPTDVPFYSFSPDSSKLVAVTYGDGAIVYSAPGWGSTTVPWATLTLDDPIGVAAVDFSASGNLLVLAASPYLVDATLHEYDLGASSYVGATSLPSGDGVVAYFLFPPPPATPNVVTTGASGAVLDATGAPAAGRVVRVYDRTTGALITSTTTDAEGKFTTSDIGSPAEIQVVLMDNSTPALNDLIYRVAP